MIKAVIFDLDGVIVSTDELHYHAWKQIADVEGIYFDYKINNRLRGVNREQSLEIILELASRIYSQEEKLGLMVKKNQIYVFSLRNLTKESILPNIVELISRLKQMRLIIAIGSSSKNAKTILERIGLLEEFDYISDGNMIERSKPFPDVFEKVKNHFKLKACECIVIEDAISGIDAAKKAGMIAVAVGDAINYQKADWKLDNILDLIEIISKYGKE